MSHLSTSFFLLPTRCCGLVLSLLVLLSATPARAALIRWDGGGGTTAWTNALNWSTDVVPTAADDVVLDNQLVAGSYGIVLTGLGQQVRSLQVGYVGSATTITLTIAGGGAGDNLQLGGASGPDLLIASGGVVVNKSTASSAGNRGLEFVNAADSWQMTGTGTYVHQQNGGSFLNVSGINVDFAATSTFEVRTGLATTWCSATGGLSYIKRYGHLKLNSAAASAQTISLRTATDSLLVTGNLTIFNSLFQLRLSSNSGFVRAHVLGNVIITDAQLYVSAGSSGSMLVVDGNVQTVNANARVGAATAIGNPGGTLLIGGNMTAYYAGSSNNESLVFWKPGAVTVSQLSPVAGSVFKAIEVRKPCAINADITFSNASNRLTVYDGGDINTNGYVIGGDGKFELFANGILRITSPDGITSGNTLAGNIQTTGTRTYHSDARYWYTGTTNQVTGDGLPATVRELRAATPSATTLITLTNPVAVANTLTLTTGRIVLGNVNLTMLPAAVLVGGSSTSYVRTNVTLGATGALVREVPNTNVDVIFPIGTTTYTPARLTQAVAATADNFRIRVFDGTYDQGISGEQFVFNVVNRTWIVEEGTVGGANVSLTLQWTTADEQPSFQRSSTRIRHFTGGSYDVSMAHTAASGTDPYALTRTGITSFSPFIIGDGTMPPLPVELVGLRLHLQDRGVRLAWTTASERNSSRFEVQRSLSGTSASFRTIGTVAGQGTTQETHDYTWLDERLPATAARLYYRLRQVDADGRAALSDVRAVEVKGLPLWVTIYPNPATEQLTVDVAGNHAGAVVEVIDGLGRLVYQSGPLGEEPIAFDPDISHLRAGTYVLVVRNPDGQQQRVAWVKAD